MDRLDHRWIQSGYTARVLVDPAGPHPHIVRTVNPSWTRSFWLYSPAKPEWRNWQTHQTQNLARGDSCGGSTPPSGTIESIG